MASPHATAPRCREIVTEMLASAALCGAVLALARSSPAHTAAAAMVAMAICGTLTRTATTTPNAAFAVAANEDRDTGDVAARVLAQLAGGALAGLSLGLFGASIGQPPTLASLDAVREGVGALALTLVAGRRGASAVVAGAASAFGARFVGSPSVLVATAFAGMATGSFALIGDALAAQAIGIVLAMAVRSMLDSGVADLTPVS